MTYSQHPKGWGILKKMEQKETKKERESFIGCTKCYRKKRDCKCDFGDFHRIPERRFDFWKFELVEKACGKEITTSRQDRDDAKHCGDVDWEGDIMLCSECEKKLNGGGRNSSHA